MPQYDSARPKVKCPALGEGVERKNKEDREGRGNLREEKGERKEVNKLVVRD